MNRGASWIDQVKEAVKNDGVRTATALWGEPTRRGRRHYWLSPLRGEDKNPGFEVKDNGRCYDGSKSVGSIINVVMAQHGEEFLEACRTIAKAVGGITIPEKKEKPAGRGEQSNITTPNGRSNNMKDTTTNTVVSSYSVKPKYHKGNKPTAADLELWTQENYGLRWKSFTDLGVELRAYYYEDFGELWSLYYPTTGPKGDGGKVRSLDRLKAGKRLAAHLPGGSGFFPHSQLQGKDFLIITAGEEKALALLAAGFRAVSVSCGEGGIPNDLCEMLIATGNSHVVFAMDGDDAGRQGTVTSWRNFGKAGGTSQYIPLPDSLDINDVVKLRGTEGLQELLIDLHSPADLEVWPEVIPLNREVPPEPFPLDALENPLHQEFVKAVANFAECPVDLAVTQSLPTIAAVIQSKARYEVTHRELPCIYAVGLAASGDRKSPVERCCSEPLHEIFKERWRDYKNEIAEGAEEAEVRANRIRTLKKQAGAAKDDKDVAAKLAMVRELKEEEPQIQPPQPLIATEATGAGIKRCMMRPGSNETLFFADSEARLVEILFCGAFEGGEADTDIIQKAYSADVCNGLRGKDDSVQGQLSSPTLSIGLIVQVDIMEKFLRNESAVYKGSVGRFLFSWPKSLAGRRKFNTVEPPERLKQWWRSLIRDLYDHNPSPNQYGERGWFCLSVEPAAVQAWRAFMLEIEPERDPERGSFALDGKAMLTWAGKLEGHVIRIAIALHAILNASGYTERPITRRTMESAIRIARYYMAHARRVFVSYNMDPVVADAKTVLVWMEKAMAKHKTAEPTLSQINDEGLKHWDEERKAAAIKRLQDHGYVKMEVFTSKRGGRPRTSYRLNPNYGEQIHQKAQKEQAQEAEIERLVTIVEGVTDDFEGVF